MALQHFNEVKLLCRCGNASTYQVPSADVTSQGEKVTSRLQLSEDDDVTVECVAYNSLGESRQALSHRRCGQCLISVMSLRSHDEQLCVFRF